jgi:hypothetical protein
METLKSIAAAIRKNLADAAATRAAWVENTLERAELLHEARTQYASDADFGRWLADEEIEINPHSRAALLKMAQHPNESRDALEATESWDLRRIWENEISLAVYGQRPKTAVDSPGPSPPPSPLVKALDATLSAISSFTHSSTSPDAGRLQRAADMMKAVDWVNHGLLHQFEAAPLYIAAAAGASDEDIIKLVLNGHEAAILRTADAFERASTVAARLRTIVEAAIAEKKQA